MRLDALAAHVTPDWARRLGEVLAAHRGPAEVHLWVRGPAKTTVYRLGPRVAVRPELWADLKAAVVLTPPP